MDLQTLLSYLQGQATPLTLRATDTNLPPGFQAFLGTLPGRELVVAPDPSTGLRLQNNRLTISGTTSAVWPLQGLRDVAVTLASIELTIEDQGTGTVAYGGVAHGTLPFSSTVAVPVLVSAATTSPTDPPTWQVTLAQNAANLTPLQVILLGSAGGALPFDLPAGLDFLTQGLVVDKDAYSITFHPNTTYEAYTRFVLNAPAATWKPVPDIFEFDGLSIVGANKTNSFGLTLIGHLAVEGVALDAGLTIMRGSAWPVFVRPTPPAQAFPGLAALAHWIGAGDVVGSFTNHGLSTSGLDAAISSVSAVVDVTKFSLVSLNVATILTLGALQLDVVITLPGITVQGSLHNKAPLKVKDLLTSLSLPPDLVPEALTIATAEFVAALALGSYAVSFEVLNLWTIGPLTLEETGLRLTYSQGNGLTGRFDCEFGIADKARVVLLAEYDGPQNGWLFQGGLDPATPVAMGDVLTLLADKFGITQVPEPVKSLVLTELLVSYATGTGTFQFECAGTFEVHDQAVDLSVTIRISQQGQSNADATDQTGKVSGSKGYDAFFSGRLTLHDLEFDVVFDTSKKAGAGSSENTFIATYQEVKTASLNLQRMVAAVSATVAADIPADISIDLKQAKFVFFAPAATDQAPTPAKQFLLAFELGTSFSLADIPVVGSKLPASLTAAVNDLQVLYCSASFAPEAVGVVNPLLPAGIYPLAAAGTTQGLTVLAELQLGEATTQLTIGGSNASATPPAAPAPAGAPAAPAATTLAAAAPAPAPIKWIDIQKQLGPIQFQRLGVSYAEGILMFALDAAVTLGPVSFSAQGLAFGSSLSTFSPKFDLRGLGVSYSSPALTIEGAILKVPADELAPGVLMQYDGALIVQVEKWGLSALASYAQMADGMPSLFIFIDVNATLGGQPYFMVEGLMGGFGFNRTLVLPSFDQVQDFPLLALGGPSTGGSAQGQAMHTLQILEGEVAGAGGTKTQWIVPQEGQYWLAAGIKFSSFEIVQGELLLVAEFGNDLQFAVLGLAWLSLPQGAGPSETFVFVALQMEAVLKPQEGYFGVAASLTRNSFVLTKDCHITGGFAFDLWFGKSPNAGQVVMTLGGYHPAFKPPPFYPLVARLGFNWPVSGEVSLKGGAYFAITPACGMAGGSLEALYQSGIVKAWFTAQADMLVTWHPFSFVADIRIELGASVRLNLLVCHKTVTVSLGASLNLWGPPLGGKVRVHVVVVTVTVHFGSDGAPNHQDPLDWTGLKTLLPAPADVCNVAANSGLTQTLKRDSTTGKVLFNKQAPVKDATSLWVVRAGSFSFTTQSAVPASQLTYGPDHANAQGSGTIDIRPMNLTGVQSVHNLRISRDRADADALDVSRWTLTPTRSNVAATLWGAPLRDGRGNFVQTPAQPAADVIQDQLSGYFVQAPAAVAGDTFGVVSLEALAVEYILPGQGQSPLSTAPTRSADYQPVVSDTVLQDLANLATQAPQRTALYQALQAAALYSGANDPMLNLAAGVESLFADNPLEQR
ncbi:hypothetical protein E5K00_03725 [Hymenobacter aquaticus]|uniref:DUF6603 domain-containing protein n=1 Tax=Hymenobacter aquaticus TaxID=1867101 RepID=A0A4Z0Q3P8_9BACT|nr:DUF6603 domain-containing protein [Hymenobacter aquaticus]TGE24335.1 hypothetical protein E5K00_03725 [Hymenobacter aquaticus]